MSDLRLPRRLPLLLFGAWLLAPLMPGVPPFWLTLANYAGIAAIIALGLVVLTGCGGMTSFAQATFMGFGAYASALLTTAAGVSPWLALPASLLASGGAALLIGAITLRLSGHYLALGTIAWAVSAYYVFGNLDLVGRNDGISGIPPLRLGDRGTPGRGRAVPTASASHAALAKNRPEGRWASPADFSSAMDCSTTAWRRWSASTSTSSPSRSVTMTW